MKEAIGPTLSETDTHYLNSIIKSVGKMGRLIDDLLNFSRNGRSELRRDEIDLEELLEATIQELQPEIKDRNIVWKKNPLPTVEADPSLLRQVFSNLLFNAVKYSRPRDPAEIEIGSIIEPGETVIFVRDNGVGFDMQYADKLFESSSACTATTNSKAPASASPMSDESSPATAAAPGPKAKSTKAPPSTSPAELKTAHLAALPAVTA